MQATAEDITKAHHKANTEVDTEVDTAVATLHRATEAHHKAMEVINSTHPSNTHHNNTNNNNKEEVDSVEVVEAWVSGPGWPWVPELVCLGVWPSMHSKTMKWTSEWMPTRTVTKTAVEVTTAMGETLVEETSVEEISRVCINEVLQELLCRIVPFFIHIST